MSDSPPLQPLDSNPPPPPPPLEAGAFSFENAFSVGFALFQQHYAVLLGASAIMFVVILVNQAVGMILQAAFLKQAPGVYLLGLLIWSVFFGLGIMYPISAALLMPAVKALRSGNGSVADIFAGYKRFPSVVLFYLLIFAATLVALLPLFVIMMTLGIARVGPGVAVAAFLFLLVLYLPAFIYAGTRIFFATTILLDTERGRPDVLQAIKTSWNMTRGIFWPLFGIVLVASIIAGASILLCGVGIAFLGYPIYMGVLGAAYVQLTGNATSTARTEHCARCGYGLSPTDAVCPQCGSPRSLYGPRGL